MKKIGIILLVGITLMMLTGCGCAKKEDVKDGNILDNKTEMKQGDLTFSNITIRAVGASNVVKGEVENKGGEKSYNLQVKMYNEESGRMLGVAVTTLEKLKKDEKRTFEISVMGDYSTVDNFEVIATEIK